MPPVSLTPGGKIAAGDVDTGGNLPPMSTMPVFAASIVDCRWKICHRYQTTLAELVAKFAAGVVDTGGKFAAGVVATSGKFATDVVDTGGAPWLANISVNFRKKSK